MGDISRQFRHLMWYVFAGSSGGMERIRIAGLLRDMPSGTRKISEKLDMEPSAVLNHVKILMDNGMVELGGKKDDSMFFLSGAFENEISTFSEILERLGLNPKKKDIDWKDFEKSYDTPTIWSDSD